MEFQIPFSLLLLFLAFFYLFTKLRITSTSPDRTPNQLPPQPWRLPLIGHLHHLSFSGSLPHHALGNLAKKLGPVIHLELGEFDAVVISSPDLAKQVMKTNDLSFANRPKLLTAEIIGYNYTDIAFSPYGDYWRQMRKICILELLSSKKVKSFGCIREQESGNLIESIMKQGPVEFNLTEKIFTVVNVIVCRVAIGSICKDQAKLITLLQQIVSFSGGFDLSDLFPSFKVLHMVTGMRNKLMRIRSKIDEILDEVISDNQQRRAGGESENEDLLNVLLRLKDDGGIHLTSDNVKGVIMDMLTAGTDTSSITIEWTMFELMINPRVMHKLQTELRRVLKGKKKVYESDIKDLNYLGLVIKETLRLHPPLPLSVPRECREKCEIGGYTINVNTKVIINVWNLGRDPDYWTDPESFIPERFSDSLTDFKGTHFEYIPFGAGRRICPGYNLGLASVELILTRLLYHFDWKLPNGVNLENLDRSETLGATLKRKSDLYLVPIVYDTN